MGYSTGRTRGLGRVETPNRWTRPTHPRRILPQRSDRHHGLVLDMLPLFVRFGTLLHPVYAEIRCSYLSGCRLGIPVARSLGTAFAVHSGTATHLASRHLLTDGHVRDDPRRPSCRTSRHGNRLPPLARSRCPRVESAGRAYSGRLDTASSGGESSPGTSDRWLLLPLRSGCDTDSTAITKGAERVSNDVQCCQPLHCLTLTMHARQRLQTSHAPLSSSPPSALPTRSPPVRLPRGGKN